MNLTIEHKKEKFFIGLELRTNNEKCSLAMPAHKDRFFKENIPSQIPNKINGDILALYTDYEGDHTKPYSWVLGCEVSSLEQVPEGLRYDACLLPHVARFCNRVQLKSS